MDLTPSQLSSLNEMGIPVWVLRSENIESKNNKESEQAFRSDCLVLIEADRNAQQAHRLLQAMLFSIGLSPEQFSVISSDQLAELQASTAQQKVLLVLGESFAQSLWGKTVVRGKSHQTSDTPISTVISFDLDELLSSPEKKALVWQDLLLVKQLLNAI
ncbi:MAG: DNA polymerase III subunit psi [Methylophaga sp.]|nr:DNA polymerase III subunit psi [Methylophaga sp.]